MSERTALLLNASNMDQFPVYPYPFIQLPAVARQWGVDVICRDLLDLPGSSWSTNLRNMIREHDPALVMITLRNTDTLTLKDYEGDHPGTEGGTPYFPIERTGELIAAVREVSDLKIVLGGFGFSLLPEDIMRHLRPDIGVVGGADPLFERFDEVVAGDLDGVANLLYFSEDRLVTNPRVLCTPLQVGEYTPGVITEMMAFYRRFPTPGFEGAPVEVSRGCCHTCRYCAEPHAVGGEVRYRDLSAVMSDIELLVEHGISRIYLISSELNPEGNGFILELADRIGSLNEGLDQERRVTWYGANYLLKFSADEYRRLYGSGFTGGWFEVTALDDENAAAMRTPYRNDELLGHLKEFAHFSREWFDPQAGPGRARPETPIVSDGYTGPDTPLTFSLFLGNPATTTATIRNTIRVANREGLQELFTGCGINTYVRVFDYLEPDEATQATTYSITPDLERTPYRQLLPSFSYPPALLRNFGSPREIELMFEHVIETYLTTKYRESRGWTGFLGRHATAEEIRRWLRGSPRRSEERPDGEVVAAIVAAGLDLAPDIFESLSLPRTTTELNRLTPYQLATTIYRKWSSEEEFTAGALAAIDTRSPEWQRELLRFTALAILHQFNIVIRSDYRQLFIAE